jgi:hypothetical protein
MKENDIKDTWKPEVDSNIKSYSDSELNEIVVKSVRKSMKSIQLGGIFQFVIITCMIYFILTLFFSNSVEMKLLNSTGLLILLVSSLLWQRSDRKMNRYKYDMPVKEWLEYRINELNKTIHIQKKYKIPVICLAFFTGFGFYAVNQIILKVPFNPILSGTIFVGHIIWLVILTHFLEKKYRKILKDIKDLNELYKQFEELKLKNKI